MLLYFSNSAPSSSSAFPSSCTDISEVHPITHATRGFFFRFGYFRKLLTVSKIISSSGVTANPIRAASGLPSWVAVASTPNFSPSKKRKTSAKSMIDCPLLSFDSNVTPYDACLVRATSVLSHEYSEEVKLSFRAERGICFRLDVENQSGFLGPCAARDPRNDLEGCNNLQTILTRESREESRGSHPLAATLFAADTSVFVTVAPAAR